MSTSISINPTFGGGGNSTEADSVTKHATDPVSPKVGDMWINLTDGKLKVHTPSGTVVLEGGEDEFATEGW